MNEKSHFLRRNESPLPQAIFQVFQNQTINMCMKIVKLFSWFKFPDEWSQGTFIKSKQGIYKQFSSKYLV